MTAMYRALFLLVPFLAIVLVLRSCREGEAQRWLARVEDYDDGLEIVVQGDDLIVLAPDRAEGARVADEVRRFRAAVDEEWGDLLGVPPERRLVVVVFSSVELVRDYAGRFGGIRHDPTRFADMVGYTDRRHGAVFVPVQPSLATLRHEVVHWIMGMAAGHGVRYSPWLSEGLAQAFERLPPGVGPGRAPLIRQIARGLDVNRLLDLQDYGEFVGGQATRNYAEALVLASFLLKERDPAKLKGYIRYEQQSDTSRWEAFHRLYDHDGDAFREDLRAFLRGLGQG